MLNHAARNIWGGRAIFSRPTLNSVKYFLNALFLLSIATLSCNKPDGDGGITPVDRSWKVGSTTYKVNNYSQSGETYSAYDTGGSSINFSFASYPPAAGSYRVVGDTATLGAGQVKVYVGSFGTSANTYCSTGSDGVSATVSFENSKIRIVLPDTWAKKISGSSDSLKISATLAPFQ